jgi:hypothetical protein
MTTTDTSHSAYVLYAADVALNNLRAAMVGDVEPIEMLPEREWVLLNTPERFRTIEAGYLGDDDEWDESHGDIDPEKVEGYVGSWLLAMPNRYGSVTISRKAGKDYGWVSFRAHSNALVLGSINVFGPGVARMV